MNNMLLIGVILLVIGGATAAAVANDFLSNQDDGGVNFKPNSGFGKKDFNTNVNGGVKTQNNNLNINNNVTNNIYVVNVAIIGIWNQYIDEVNLNNDINFDSSAGESLQIGGYAFDIPNGTMMSNGYARSGNDFYSSEIYQTSDGTAFGIMVITNPNGTAEELANELANEKDLSVTKVSLQKIGSSGSLDIYVFNYDGITHYIYNDGNAIVIIVMNQENNYLFMYLTNSSTDGKIDESNPYYSIAEEDTSDEEPLENEEDGSQNTAYDDNSYDDSSYGNSYDNYSYGDNYEDSYYY